MGAKSKDLPLFNPAISFAENTSLNRAGIDPPYLVPANGVAATDFINAGTSGNFVYFNPTDAAIAPNGLCGNLLQFPSNEETAVFSGWWNCRMSGDERSIALASDKRYIRLTLSMEKMSGAYAYNSSTGQVYYAGKDSPYYGKTSIND